MNEIREHMKVVGKDGPRSEPSTVFEGGRIKLTKGSDGQHHYIDAQLVAGVEGDSVKLSMDSKSVPMQ